MTPVCHLRLEAHQSIRRATMPPKVATGRIVCCALENHTFAESVSERRVNSGTGAGVKPVRFQLV